MSTVELANLVSRLEAVVCRLESKGSGGAGGSGDGHSIGKLHVIAEILYLINNILSQNGVKVPVHKFSVCCFPLMLNL